MNGHEVVAKRRTGSIVHADGSQPAHDRHRDTFRLLIRFAIAQRGKPPTKLGIEDLNTDLIGNLLVHVETSRGNGARSRNTPLAAIRSFFRYVAMSEAPTLGMISALSGDRFRWKAVSAFRKPYAKCWLPDRGSIPTTPVCRLVIMHLLQQADLRGDGDERQPHQRRSVELAGRLRRGSSAAHPRPWRRAG